MLKSLVKDAAIYGIADFFFKFLHFATFPIFAHFFSVEQFGVFSLATTLAALISVVFNCGLNNAVQRYYMDPATSEDDQPVYVTTGLVCLTAFSITVGAAALAITYYFKDEIFEKNNLPWTMIAIAVIGTLPNQIFLYCADLIRIRFKPYLFAFLNALQNGLSISLSLFFVLYLNMGIEGYLLGWVLSFILVSPLALWSIRISLTRKASLKMCRTLIQFGYPFIFAGIAYWILGSMDRWMLAELGTITDVGIYSTAFKFATILIFINTAFGRAWSPHALQVYKTMEDYRTIYSRLFSLWFFILVLIGAAMSLFCKEALMLLTPSSYWPAEKVIPYISFGLVLYGTTQVTAIGISLERRTHHFTFATWLSAITNFFLNYYLIPLWGAEGAAFATLVSYFLLTLYYLICSQKIHPIPLELKKIAVCFLMIPSTIYFNFLHQNFPWENSVLMLKIAFFIALASVGGLTGIFRIADLFSIFKKTSEKPVSPSIKDQSPKTI